MSIYSIAKIEAEAIAGAKKSSNVNDVCPYPFATTAGYIFRKTFEAAIKEAEDPINVGAALDITHSLDQFEAVAA